MFPNNEIVVQNEEEHDIIDNLLNIRGENDQTAEAYRSNILAMYF